MSVKLMSAIFDTEFRDLEDAEGNKTKASTAKLVLLALADHANDEGEGAYPSIDRLVKKTALSRNCIIEAFDALKYNGLISYEGVSRLGTSNYTVNPACYPGRDEGGNPRLLVISAVVTSNPRLPEGVISDDPNHPLITKESSIGGLSEKELAEVNAKVDAQLKFSQAPGLKRLARIEAIQSFLGSRLQINTETDRWKEFAKFVDDCQQKGQKLDRFITWLTSQEDFNIKFWSPRRMREMWPQAFVKATAVQKSEPTEYEKRMRPA